MAGQAAFEKFKAYYGHADYGHQYVTAALDGSGDFQGLSTVMRNAFLTRYWGKQFEQTDKQYDAHVVKRALPCCC